MEVCSNSKYMKRIMHNHDDDNHAGIQTVNLVHPGLDPVSEIIFRVCDNISLHKKGWIYVRLLLDQGGSTNVWW